MIFTEIVIHNFGVYKGRHTVDLKPASEEKPIILFGGLNGGGKTTFLDALQLTLYGKHARCSNRGDLSYSDYLRDAINNYVAPDEGAALELEFIHFNEGVQTTYRIKRLWRSSGKGINESMEVIKDGELDPIMSEYWYECVDEFIPINISSLFFFDGEKIESLANSEKSAEIIKTGIMSLLGLDIVDKLSNDLRAIERRRLKQQSDKKAAQLIDALESDIKVLKENREKLNDEKAALRKDLDKIENDINKAKIAYREKGGEAFEQREIFQQQQSSNEQQLDLIKTNIRKFAEGPAPLLLLKVLIGKAQHQSEIEKASINNRGAIDILVERDKEVIEHFKQNQASEASVDLLARILEDDANKRLQSAAKKTPLNIQPDILLAYDSQFFNDVQKEAQDLLSTYEKQCDELAISERKVSTVPDIESIQKVAKELEDAEGLYKTTSGKFNIVEKLYDDAHKAVTNKQVELERLLHVHNDEQIATHRAKKILEHTSEVRKTLSIYRKALINKHIGRLEDLIRDSFSGLIRKNDLIQAIQIDPDDFSLHVINPQGETIPAKSLSAGERQLLAISILWGLAKASGRPLPSIIDTPLGRLDSEHRRHLVDNYFPNASHQVILLSTDTEIDCQYRDDLAKSIGKEYHIQYQEKLQSSTISPGYF